MDNGEPSKQAGEEMADDFRTGLNTAKDLGFPSRPSSKPHNRPQGHPEAPEGKRPWLPARAGKLLLGPARQLWR